MPANVGVKLLSLAAFDWLAEIRRLTPVTASGIDFPSFSQLKFRVMLDFSDALHNKGSGRIMSSR